MKEKKSKILKIAVLAFAAYIVVTMIQLQVDIKMSQDELKTIQQQRDEQKLQNEELERLIDSESDNEYLERRAREEYGYVMPDERIFVDMSGN